jgi:hypothetical protein
VEVDFNGVVWVAHVFVCLCVVKVILPNR